MDTRNEELAQILNKFLASASVLSIKLKNYHWNVIGPHFENYHKFFEELYDEIDGIIDEIAEKVRMLELRPLSSMKEFLDETFIQENQQQLSAHQMFKNLEKNYAILIDYNNKHIPVVENLKSYTIADFLTNQNHVFEKRLWMIKSICKAH